MQKIYDLAIIGAGPAGIASAVESVLLGVEDVIIFEKGDNHSTTIRNYYKDEKRVDKNWRGAEVQIDGNILFADGTKESTIEFFGELIDKHDVESKFNVGIDFVKKEGDIFEITTERGEKFYSKFVIIAIGVMGKPNKPSYKIPPSISDIVNFNPNSCRSGEKLLVVGGGDSALEYAYMLSATNDVTISYRQSSFSRASEQNIDILNRYTKEGKIVQKIGVDIDYIADCDGKVEVFFFDKSSEVFDRMVLAIGGASPADFLRKCGIELDENETPITEENLQSSVEGLFIAGDIIAKKGGSIVVGLNHAFKIVNRIKELTRTT